MKEAARLLAEAMFVREKYMAMSLQENCQTTRKALNEIDDEFNVDIILKNREIKADRHKGSYVPLLCYVIQLTPHWGFSVADYIKYYAYF